MQRLLESAATSNTILNDIQQINDPLPEVNNQFVEDGFNSDLDAEFPQEDFYSYLEWKGLAADWLNGTAGFTQKYDIQVAELILKEGHDDYANC